MTQHEHGSCVYANLHYNCFYLDLKMINLRGPSVVTDSYIGHSLMHSASKWRINLSLINYFVDCLGFRCNKQRKK